MRKGKQNLLDLIPERQCRWQENPGGQVHLIIPRFKNPLLRKAAVKLGKSETVKVFYDEVGSRTWLLIDGNRTVAQIGDSLEAEMGSRVHPLFQRLTEFISILYRNKFIRFKNF